MFTGVITDSGILKSMEGEEGKRLVIETGHDVATLAVGSSIACNGICLTVVEKSPHLTSPRTRGEEGGGWFAVDASPTTLAVTTMKDWRTAQRINLERALKLGDELGGHIVTGHIDGMAKIEEVKEAAGSRHYTLTCPPDLAVFIAAKGSVTLDGVSFTVTWAEDNRFGLTLIPHTLEQTNWGEKKAGDKVNLEVDMLARYVLRSLKSEV